MNIPTHAQVHEAYTLWLRDGGAWDSLAAFVAGQYPRHSAAFHANMITSLTERYL